MLLFDFRWTYKKRILKFVFEPMKLIAEDPQLRLVDTLFMTPPNMKSNSWRKILRLVLDVIILYLVFPLVLA